VVLTIWLAGALIAGCGVKSGQLVTPSNATKTDSPALHAVTLTPTSLSSPSPTLSLPLASTPTGSPSFTPTSADSGTTQTTPDSSPTLLASDTPTVTLAPTQSQTLSASPTPTSTPASSQASKQCVDKAGYFGDVTVPDDTSFQQGDTIVKTWRFRNEGTCVWGPSYSLVFVKGDPMGGATSVPLPVANPGDTFDVSIKLVAPSQGGSYMGVYEFQDDQGTKFGVNADGIDKFWVKIKVVYIGPAPTPGPTSAANPPGCAAQQNTDYESQVVALVNEARAAAGLPALRVNPALSQAAYLHSLDMACTSSLSHTGSDGSDWYARVKAQGYAYSYASENIYAGAPNYGGDPAGAMDWWMNSPIHKANILSTKVTEIGVGYVYFSDSTYGGYFTIDFGKP
jgi:uncharacterized protein YkwD